jgi:Aminoglycoside adenylyltransferase, C-terminal domain
MTSATASVRSRPPSVEWARSATRQLRRLLGEDLVAAYLIGSGALGGFVPEQSDLDLVAVCAEPLPDEHKQAVIDVLTREAMSWPVRGLEFVLYPRAAVATPSPAPRFEINLNVGRRMPLHVSLDPALEPAHWFVIDLSILREHGVALTGARRGRSYASPAPARRPARVAGLACGHERQLHSTVLNAGRAWRYAEEGAWSSKDDAARWVLARTEDRSLVERALAIRHGTRSPTLERARVDEFVRGVRTRIEQASLEKEQALVSGREALSS